MYRVVRFGRTVLWIDPGARLYDIAREFINYLNRDRRDIVFLEDKLNREEEKLAEAITLCEVMARNMEWCSHNMKDMASAKVVSGWAAKATKAIEGIQKEKPHGSKIRS